jgi:hypothetical protein
MDMETLFEQSPAHKDLFERIRAYCLSFPGTNERISHGAPSFFISDKHSFLQYRVNHHGDGKIALWCAAPPGIQALLIEASPDIYFRPAYVGHLGWVGLRLDQDAAWTDISGIIGEAYLHRAPKKLKETLKQS